MKLLAPMPMPMLCPQGTEGRWMCGSQFCARGNWPEDNVCPGCNRPKGTRGGGGGGGLHCMESTEGVTAVVEV